MALASPTYKASIKYEIADKQEIKLRVSQIPTEYNWIDRDIMGRVKVPPIGSTIYFETPEPVELKAGDQKYYLPIGTRFTAKISEIHKPKWFQGDGYIELNFYEMEVAGNPIDIEGGINLDTDKSSMSKIASKAARYAAYTLGGALMVPIATYQIGGLLGISAMSNPYVIGASVGSGAVIGLATGIIKKGKKGSIEPGKEIKITLESPWLLSKLDKLQEDLDNAEQKQIAQEQAKLVDLQIHSVKKKKSAYKEDCLEIKLSYKNKSTADLKFLSFRLVDSMKRDYFPSSRSMRSIFDSESDELPQQGKLQLYYCVEFIKALHELEVRDVNSYKLLAKEKIVY